MIKMLIKNNKTLLCKIVPNCHAVIYMYIFHNVNSTVITLYDHTQLQLAIEIIIKLSILSNITFCQLFKIITMQNLLHQNDLINHITHFDCNIILFYATMYCHHIYYHHPWMLLNVITVIKYVPYVSL